MHKEKTEAILLHNRQTKTRYICSFTPPGIHEGEIPLFELASIGETRGGRSRSFSTTTAYHGSYSVQCPKISLREKHNKNYKNGGRTTMAVRSSENDNRICATIEENNSTWNCWTICGVDPAMMVCFVFVVLTHRNLHDRRGSSWIPGIDSIEVETNNKPYFWSGLQFGSIHSFGPWSLGRKSSSGDLPPITSFIKTQ